MSSQTADEIVAAEGNATGALGILATIRQMPRHAKALLAGVLISKLAGFLQIFLVLFLTHQGFSRSQAGLALGLYGAGAVVGTFTGGWLSDRLSARTATMISMFGSAALTVSIIYVKFYPLLALVVLMTGMVAQLYRPAAQSLITELTPKAQLVMVTAVYMLCFNLGAVAAPLIGIALASVSYDLLFWAEGLAVLAFGMIAINVLPRRAKAVAKPKAPAGAASGYLAVLGDWRYVTFLGAFLLMAMVYCQYTATLPLAIVRSGMSMWWYGAIITLNGIIAATCQMTTTKFVQKWPLLLTQVGGFGLLALGYGVYAIAMVPVLLILGTMIWTLSELIGVPTIWAYPGMIAPAHLRGRYFGALQSVYGLGATLGPILGIILFDRVGQQVWLWAAGVGALATVVGQVGMRRPRPVAEAPVADLRSAHAEPQPAATGAAAAELAS